MQGEKRASSGNPKAFAILSQLFFKNLHVQYTINLYL